VRGNWERRFQLEETPRNICESWDRSIIEPTDRFGCWRLELSVREFVWSRDHIDEVSRSKVSCVYKSGFCHSSCGVLYRTFSLIDLLRYLTMAQANYRDCYRLGKNSCVISIYCDM
jgi:hypothetical protein